MRDQMLIGRFAAAPLSETPLDVKRCGVVIKEGALPWVHLKGGIPHSCPEQKRENVNLYTSTMVMPVIKY